MPWKKYIIYAFLSIIIFSLIILCVLNIEKFSQTQAYNGVCAFDLDNTITCGHKNAKDAIDMCKKHNFKIAINTARISPYYADIKLDELGLHKDDFIDDFYHGEQFSCSFSDQDCFSKSVASVKTKHLKTLANKYGVHPRKVILFDDLWSNIKDAEINGFSAIFANNPSCGLQNNVLEQLESIIIS
jgi:FMN phosphatase YigB (HAD superfamily)